MTQDQRAYDEIATLAEQPDRLPEATGRALALLNENAQDHNTLFLLGYCWAKADNYGLAYQVLRRCVELSPKNAVAWHNLGKACYELRQPDQAEQCWRRALQLDPKLASSLDGLGLIHLHRGEFLEATKFCDRALALEPELVDTRVNRGMAKLALGEWTEGWRGYDANVGHSKDRSERDFGPDAPRWDGAKGRVVVARGDQGLGDELIFSSCVPDLVRDSKQVIIECDRRTVGLFRRSFPMCDVYGTRYDDTVRWPARYNVQARVLFGELPRFYRNADSDFPGTPYLVAAPELRVQFRALFEHMGRRPKIGIAWNGGRPQTYTKRRSVALASLLPILRKDADFISLEYRTPDGKQKAEGKDAIADEIEDMQKRHGIAVKYWPWATQCYDYDVTMALLAELDLVICVTTAVMDGCAALGKPCWVLVPEQPMWRLRKDGSRFVWGNSVELFRQSGGTWPINQMADKLEGWLSDFASKRATGNDAGREAP